MDETAVKAVHGLTWPGAFAIGAIALVLIVALLVITGSISINIDTTKRKD